MDIETLVERIEALSKAKGVSKTKALVESGAGKDFIANIKKGQTPSITKLQKIANYFDVSVDYLLGNINSTIQAGTVIGMDNFNFEQCKEFSLLNNGTESASLFGPEVTEAYKKLSEKDKLEVQLEIFKRAEGKE